MKVYISKHSDKVFLSDIPIYNDGKQLVFIGFPRFQFDLSKAEDHEGSIMQLLQRFGINKDGKYEMELRRWPVG